MKSRPDVKMVCWEMDENIDVLFFLVIVKLQSEAG